MGFVIVPRDLTHYPFLKESIDFLSTRNIKMNDIALSSVGKKYLDASVDRILYAIKGKEHYPESSDLVSDIVTYILARILVSCTKDRNLIVLLARMEAKRAYFYLNSEFNANLKNYVCSTLDISVGDESLPVLKYIRLVSTIHDSKWRLINRNIDHGLVNITEDEENTLIRESIMRNFLSNMPLTISAEIQHSLAPWSDKIIKSFQNHTYEVYGEINESAYPPCIQELLSSVISGVNIPHAGRFVITTFLKSIGMTSSDIANLFINSSDFNPDMTIYQVDHIISHDYASPNCQTMLTYGICVNKDKICGTIGHPLNYYSTKKKTLERKKRQLIL